VILHIPLSRVVLGDHAIDRMVNKSAKPFLMIGYVASPSAMGTDAKYLYAGLIH
jgi:hypothetical protein